MRIERDGYPYELTAEELEQAYQEVREANMMTWVEVLLDENGYDVFKMPEELKQEIYNRYMKNMEINLGELEHEMFDEAIYDEDIQERLKGMVKEYD